MIISKRCWSLLQTILVPRDIRAQMTGDEHIQITVAVHVDQSDVVCGLVRINRVRSEITFAVVLEPGSDEVVLSAGDCVDIAVAVDVAYGQRMRAGEVRVDLVRGPLRRF